MPPTTGTVTGRIVTPQSGEPIAGATISLTPVDDRAGPAIGPTDEPGAVVGGTSTATTDADGRFTLEVIPTDGRDWRYEATITLPGRPPRTVYLDVPDRDAELGELIQTRSTTP